MSLGAAKGQAWIEHNLAHLDAPVIAHLGAVVDFAAGTIRRAPGWVWRIFAEPSLWRRYWNDGKDFAALIHRRLGVLKRAGRVKSVQAVVAEPAAPNAIKLSGDLVVAQRQDIREAFKIVAKKTGDCTLDLTNVGAIDAAGLGQIRMLEQSLMRRGHRLDILASHQTKPALDAAQMTLQGVALR